MQTNVTQKTGVMEACSFGPPDREQTKLLCYILRAASTNPVNLNIYEALLYD